jgi:hypothetical protein
MLFYIKYYLLFFKLQKNMYIFMWLFLLITCFYHVGGVVNVDSDEQYVCVARLEEHVLFSGSVSSDSSLFIALFHISVSTTTPTIQLETTVWHQIEFATNISINGPANPGILPPIGMQMLPLLTLASTNAASAASQCPIRGTWTVDPVFLGHLRASRLFCEVRSETIASGGNIRGQIYSRRDALVAFLGDNAENGMGVFRVHKIPNTEPELAYLNYWILSTISSPTAVFQAIRASDGYLPVAVFASNNVNNETSSLGVKRWISTEDVNGPTSLMSDVFSGYPFTGPGSSNLILTSLDADTISRFTQFYRISVYSDSAVLQSNSSMYIKTGKTFWETDESIALYISIVATTAIILYVRFSKKSKK